MSSLASLISALEQAQAEIGTTPNIVCAKENVLVVRETGGSKTICLVRFGDEYEQPKTEWVGQWKATRDIIRKATSA